jgi:SAM-dependent methyltransferase
MPRSSSFFAAQDSERPSASLANRRFSRTGEIIFLTIFQHGVSKMETITAEELYAQLYDVWVNDWDGEVDFYKELIGNSPLKSNGVLEVACGTGRITRRLAEAGMDITGFDVSPELLEIARGKSSAIPNVRWVLGDMRTFAIEKQFGFVISPGHSFQFMTTPDDQVKCLEQIKRHLVPDGIVVLHLDHQDFTWIADLLKNEKPVYQKSDVILHPATNQRFIRTWGWSFEPVSQTATVQVNWEEINEHGDVIQIWEMQPKQLHCIFPFEMEHLLRRVGFSVEAVYGDFFKSELTSQSEQMIWIARNRAG